MEINKNKVNVENNYSLLSERVMLFLTTGWIPLEAAIAIYKMKIMEKKILNRFNGVPNQLREMTAICF